MQTPGFLTKGYFSPWFMALTFFERIFLKFSSYDYKFISKIILFAISANFFENQQFIEDDTGTGSSDDKLIKMIENE